MKRFALVFVIALLAGVLTAATASATMPHSGPKTLFSKRTGGSSFELRSVNPTTAATHLVESGPTFSVFAGQYSPNGAKIAYFSNQTGSYQVYVANADGSNAHAITSGATDHEYPA
jgi:Tol biopolymer transport system component